VQAINDRTIPNGLLAHGFSMQQSVTSATDYAYHGIDGWSDWLQDLFEHFGADARCEILDVLAVGDDYVAATFRISGSSALSTGRLELVWSGVTRFRDGAASSAVGFATPEEALGAVGIES